MTIDNWISLAALVEGITFGLLAYFNSRINKLENELNTAKGDVIRLETQHNASSEFEREIKKDLKEIKDYIHRQENEHKTMLITIQSTLKQLIK